MTNSQTSPERTIFLDNIRYLMVIFVLIFHASMSYVTIVPWWCVVDSNNHKLIDIFILVLDTFQLPVLFFISGYFVLQSLRKQTTTDFIVSKLRKLGIPLVILSLFYTPVLTYIRHLIKSPEPTSYFSYWLTQMKTLSDFTVGPKTAANTDYLSPWHLWFISILLTFMLTTAVIYHIKNKRFSHRTGDDFINPPPVEPQSKRKILMMYGVFGILMAFCAAIVNLNFIDWEWFRFSGLFLFQPTRIPVFSGVFIMGIYAHHRSWFHSPLPGHYIFWFILAGILSFAFLICMVLMSSNPAIIQPPLAVATAVIRVFLVLSWIFAFMNFGATRWNSQGPVGKQLTFCSYEIYLIHLPIVVLLQYAMMPVNLSAFIKFGLVAVMSIVITVALARLLVTKLYRLSTAGLLAGFTLATFFIG